MEFWRSCFTPYIKNINEKLSEPAVDVLNLLNTDQKVIIKS